MEYPQYYYIAVWTVYIFLILFTSIALYKKSYMHKISNGVVSVFMFVFTVFGIFAIITSDWISYVEIMREQILYTGTAATNLEDFWVKLMLFSDNNIYFFRSILYIMIYILLYYYIVKNIPQNSRLLFLLLYILMGLYIVSGGRQFFSICLFYISFELFLRRKYFIFFPFFVICFLLHKGSVLYMPSIVFLLFRPKLDKFRILFVVLVAFTLSMVVQKYLVDFMDFYFSDYSHYANFEAEQRGSRRIYYAYQFVYFLYAIYLFYLIYVLFKYSPYLSNKILQYRNFLFINYLIYLSMCAINLSFETAQRFVGIMLFLPVIMLASVLVEKNIGGALFRRVTFLIAALFALAANISISGVVGIYW